MIRKSSLITLAEFESSVGFRRRCVQGQQRIYTDSLFVLNWLQRMEEKQGRRVMKAGGGETEQERVRQSDKVTNCPCMMNCVCSVCPPPSATKTQT